jgi:hypothetical protein
MDSFTNRFRSARDAYQASRPAAPTQTFDALSRRVGRWTDRAATPTEMPVVDPVAAPVDPVGSGGLGSPAIRPRTEGNDGESMSHNPGTGGRSGGLGGYSGMRDMVNGGGPGAAGSTFSGGMFSDRLNSLGVAPVGSGGKTGGLFGGFTGFKDMIDGGGPGASGGGNGNGGGSSSGGSGAGADGAGAGVGIR